MNSNLTRVGTEIVVGTGTSTNAKLSHLSDIELTGAIKNIAVSERKLTQILLQHLAELDRRKLYLRLSYNSLFDYLIKEIGYSEGAAQRRIDAARMLHVVPELAQKIESGAIKLSQISHLQRISRSVKKENGCNISSEAKKELIMQLENQTAAKTEILVAQAFGLEIKTEEVLKPKKIFDFKNEEALKKTFQADGSVRIEFTLSENQMDLVTKAQALLSNSTGGSLKETFVQLAETLIRSKMSLKKAAATVAVENELQSTGISTAGIPESETSNTKTSNYKTSYTKIPKTITPRLRKEIRIRDQVCQFKN